MLFRSTLIFCIVLFTASCGDSGSETADTSGIPFFSLPLSSVEQSDESLPGNRIQSTVVNQLSQELLIKYRIAMTGVHQQLTPIYNNIKDNAPSSSNDAVQRFDQAMYDTLSATCAPQFDDDGMIWQYGVNSICGAKYAFRARGEFILLGLETYSNEVKRTTFTTPAGDGRSYAEWIIDVDSQGLTVATNWTEEGSNAVQSRECTTYSILDTDERRCVALLATAIGVVSISSSQ